jgi:hypothetical protein
MTRPRVSVLVAAALGAPLVFAAGAAAEASTGESSNVELRSGVAPAEATLVKASASYESTEGSVRFDVETGAEPQAEPGVEPSNQINVFLVDAPGPCSFDLAESVAEQALSGSSSASVVLVAGKYSEPTSARGDLLEKPPWLPVVPKTVSGATTTFAIQSSRLRTRGSIASPSTSTPPPLQ